MTSAWVNLGFSLVFAYFGLSMLGLYEFPLRAWHKRTALRARRGRPTRR
jgi:thiol:disulfide interchange protein